MGYIVARIFIRWIRFLQNKRRHQEMSATKQDKPRLWCVTPRPWCVTLRAHTLFFMKKKFRDSPNRGPFFHEHFSIFIKLSMYFLFESKLTATLGSRPYFYRLRLQIVDSPLRGSAILLFCQLQTRPALV